ncbi:gfo/Idh/MocA family oxidoreductase [Actinomadura craniellae]|uniref:Gfo/Idh/MocA family oxidoreductase n=1 Tax=Actinomadura craniellae TaxID=2231787 RepID=A0A365H689_9ACTN|nr:Gfo/Idh/MocA family oxidoreductase [Actinomadura craniellae]RAY14548.1 gfo/Idh/MocA family oxidoreductase [Actinomadura craniellae]
MRETVRAGIIGTGFMGRVHARAARLAGARVTGVAGSGLAKAQQAAPLLGADQAYATGAELIESGDVDVVHICTPNHLHAPLALAALDRGLAVVCEKPLATDAATAALLADRAAGAVATVPFVYRFHAMVREARQRVAAGDIGRISVIQGSYLQDWLLRPEDDNWRADPAVGGPSRTFADIGSHWCDLAEFVTGDRITAVSAQTAVVIDERASNAPVLTEDVAIVQFRTAAGAVGTVTTSQVAPGRKNRLFLEISGAAASLAFDQEQPELLWLGRREGSSTLVRDPETLSAAARPYSPLPAGHAQGYHDCFDAFVADTYTALRGERPDGLPTFADGARAALICDAVLASAGTGRWTEV